VKTESACGFSRQRGSKEAFAKLVEAYQAPVYNLAYRMLGNPTDAEDAVQETFLRAYKRFETYDASRKFSSWILSIASHYCVDRLRRRRGNWASWEELMSWRWVPDERPRPEERALQREQEDLVGHILDQLPPQYRLAIVLRYWYDYSYLEIAQITQSTQSAVKSRLHRARQMMAVKLAQAQAATPRKEPTERRISENALSRSF